MEFSLIITALFVFFMQIAYADPSGPMQQFLCPNIHGFPYVTSVVPPSAELARYCRKEIVWNDSQRWLCNIDGNDHITDFPADMIGRFDKPPFNNPEDKTKCRKLFKPCNGELYSVKELRSENEILAEAPILKNCTSESCIMDNFGFRGLYKQISTSMFEKLFRLDEGVKVNNLGVYCFETREADLPKNSLFSSLSYVTTASVVEQVNPTEKQQPTKPNLLGFGCAKDADCFRTKGGGCAAALLAQNMPNNIETGPPTNFTCRCVIDGPMRGCTRQNL